MNLLVSEQRDSVPPAFLLENMVSLQRGTTRCHLVGLSTSASVMECSTSFFNVAGTGCGHCVEEQELDSHHNLPSKGDFDSRCLVPQD